MHAVIEQARKAAGIGSMARNYPADPRERGAGFWAAFVGALNEKLQHLDDRQQLAEKQLEELASRREALERRLLDIDPDHPTNRALALAITAEGGGPEDGGLHPRDCNCDACCD